MKTKAEKTTAVETTAVEATTEKKPLANINGVYVQGDTVLTWNTQTNPKRPSGKAHKRFESYLGAHTVDDYLAAGGTIADLKYDNAKGYLTI